MAVTSHADAHLLAEVDALVGEWLALPDVADLLGVDVREVRRLLADDAFVAVRRGSPALTSVPRVLVDPEPINHFPGTWTVLADCGYTPLEALRWLFTAENGASPIELLRGGQRAEVRRRAQALLL